MSTPGLFIASICVSHETVAITLKLSENPMRKICFLVAALATIVVLPRFEAAQSLGGMFPDITQQQDYVSRRVSSYDATGANADNKLLAGGQTLTVFDEPGPGDITHIWFTLSSHEPLYLKKLVLRIYWDSESTPSVEAPIGDFYGLGLGENIPYQSLPLAVGNSEALNCYFPMPFQRRGKITLTNEGTSEARVYYNVDYRVYKDTLPAGKLYFHAQYRQCAPCRGWTNQWTTNQDPLVDNKTNLTGEENYVWMEATGRGHYVGVTMSVLQNQDKWWGEGDDMFFIDGEKIPSIKGTGTEDYFSGGWDFGRKAFSYLMFGAPVAGPEMAGSRWSVYRFHLESPITFTKSIRATIEHGSANHRSDNFYSVAYWYQTEPHAPFPRLPPVADRLPKIYSVGGPGNAGK
jgi:hypothetical protein